MYLVVHFAVDAPPRTPSAPWILMLMLRMALIQAFNAIFEVSVGRVITLAFLMLRLDGGIIPVESTAETVPDHPPFDPMTAGERASTTHRRRASLGLRWT